MIFIQVEGGIVRDVWVKDNDGECPVVIIDEDMDKTDDEAVIIEFNAWDVSNMPAKLKALCNKSAYFLEINGGKL